MKRLSALVFALLLTAPALAQVNVPFPQTLNDNSVVGRLGSGTGSGPAQGIPFATLLANLPTTNVDPRKFGLVGDGATDNTTAFNTMEALSSINVVWPAGIFCINGGGTISGNYVRNTGASNSGTIIRNCGSSNNTLLTVTGGFAVFEHMAIYGLNNVISTHPTVYLNGSTHCLLYDVTVYYGYYGIQNNSADCHMIDVDSSFSFHANFYSNNGAFYILRTSFDNPQPYGTIPSSTSAWSANASVSANAVRTVSGTPLQYSASCTTGGTAPAVVGYGLNIIDGTCTAQIAGPLYLAFFDTGASVNFVTDSDFSGFYLNAAVYSVSSSLSITNAVISGYGYGVELNGGDQVTLDNVSINFSETSANGLLATASFTGDLSVTNGMINNSPGTAVFLQGGSNINLANNRTSNLSAGGYGLGVAGATHVQSTNNNWGGTTGNPGGISLTSTTDYFQSINDDVKNAGTAITNSASGTHNLICFTIGVTATCNTMPAGGNLVDTVSAQTLTNKTLTSPLMSSPTVTSGVNLAGSSSGQTVVQAAATASGTLTVPSATDTLVGRATTDTLTNKTLTSPLMSSPTVNSGINLSGSSSGTTVLQPAATASGTITVPAATDTLVARATTDTLTNKTIAGASNTLTVRIGSDVSGLGTGVATALGNATNSNGGVVLASSGGIVPNANGGTGIGSGAPYFIGPATNVNFGSAGDYNIAVPLPSGFTRLCGLQFMISGPSGSITGATFQVWTAAGGTGTAVTTSQSPTVSTSTDNAANNAEVVNSSNINSGTYLPTSNNLFFRVGTTAAQTANVQAGYRPCP